MDRLTRNLAVAITAAASLLAWPGAAFACSSLASPTVFSAQQYRQWLADFNGVVFRGTVISVLRKEVIWPEEAEYTFNIERVWKGVATSELVIRTASDSASCGITFVLGRSYLIAADPARQPKMNASTSGYWHTRNEKEFIAALGDGSPVPK